jgi:tRNA(Ile)-lysidine synthase
MALLHVLAGLRRRVAFGLFAHGVDHGLREAAGAELDVAADFARALDVPFAQTRVTVQPGGNIQARARAARWAALQTAATATGAERIATGHHADDRAETLVMRVLRGTGAKGLAVLPPQAGNRIRPLLYARRSDIEAHIGRHEVPFRIDPSNNDPRFLRARVRHEVMPVLSAISPRVVEHMCTLADAMRGPKLTRPDNEGF